MLFNSLIYLAALIGSSAKASIDDMRIKDSSRHIDQDGNTVCYGRKGEEYYNGEKIVSSFFYDEYGHCHDTKIGVKSGKVYVDLYKRRVLDKYEKEEAESKKEAIKRGFPVYEGIDRKTQRGCVRELSTGKIIVCIAKGCTHGGSPYRKWYYDNNGYLTPDTITKNNCGVPITKDEFDDIWEGARCLCCKDLESEKCLLHRYLDDWIIDYVLGWSNGTEWDGESIPDNLDTRVRPYKSKRKEIEAKKKQKKNKEYKSYDCDMDYFEFFE